MTFAMRKADKLPSPEERIGAASIKTRFCDGLLSRYGAGMKSAYERLLEPGVKFDEEGRSRFPALVFITKHKSDHDVQEIVMDPVGARVARGTAMALTIYRQGSHHALRTLIRSTHWLVPACLQTTHSLAPPGSLNVARRGCTRMKSELLETLRRVYSAVTAATR